MPVDPLLFQPRFEEKIWGGRRLHTLLDKALPPGVPIGESWELSAVENSETVVTSGILAGRSLGSLFEESPYELVGAAASNYPAFPLLIKFIDANDRLSIQVHPDDRSARGRYREPFGKTECWYIVDAGKNGQLGLGFKRTLTQNDLREAVATGEIEQLLNTVRVKTGEVYFVPAGTVHTILDDLVIYEVQQNSNTTFRLYDWKRTDSSGNPRPLHIDEAVNAADLAFRQSYRITPLHLDTPDYRHCIRVACPYFALEEYFTEAAAVIKLSPKKSCRIVTLLAGGADLAWEGGNRALATGSTVLIPAALENCIVYAKVGCRFLLTTIPDIKDEIEKPLREAGFSPEAIASLGSG